MDLDLLREPLPGARRLEEDQITALFTQLQEALCQEETVHPLTLPIMVCGDIHGQLSDLFELFRVSGGVAASHSLLLGDFIGRGYCSLHTFSISRR